MTPQVPDKEWSCPLHDYAQTHECDCEHCELPYYTCELCAVARLVDKLDADGNVVMRDHNFSDVLMEMYRPAMVASLTNNVFFKSDKEQA